MNDTNRGDIEKAVSPGGPEMAAADPDAYPKGDPVPYTVTAKAEAALASWDMQVARLTPGSMPLVMRRSWAG